MERQELCHECGFRAVWFLATTNHAGCGAVTEVWRRKKKATTTVMKINAQMNQKGCVGATASMQYKHQPRHREKPRVRCGERMWGTKHHSILVATLSLTVTTA